MPDPTSLTARGEATRVRVLEAATAEFARFGIAGARIDRITAEARTNKAQLYACFGSKEQLFDTVFTSSLERIMDVVPIHDATDVADWAVRLYDEYLRRPDLIRLATWARLERRPAGHLVADADRMDHPKLAVISAAQSSGALAPEGAPFEVMAMVIASSCDSACSERSSRRLDPERPWPTSCSGHAHLRSSSVTVRTPR